MSFSLDRREWDIKTATGSDSPISLRALENYTERRIVNKTFRRTQGGQLNAFSHVGSYQEFSVPVDYVTSADATIVNSWWTSQTNLHLSINRNYPSGHQFPVRITNELNPLSENFESKFSILRGIVFLTTYDNSTPTIMNPFLLDNSSWGILDTNILG